MGYCLCQAWIFLGVLECVYVLKDALAVFVVLLHLVLEREDVDGVQATAD